MADSIVHDVVVIQQPSSLIADGVSDHTTNNTSQGARGDGLVKENGVALHELGDDAHSDTDTSRAGSLTEDKSDVKPVKKFVTSKPVSFAKYSVPKVIAAASVPTKPAGDKASSVATTPTATTPLGRPRLVAKSTNSLQQKPVVYKSAAPDPMQVWNKNRATPQPSTKHLTDEELKQQYGIHLTSRLQASDSGKEAKWADIDDDDEEDWAPETIEWNDGTKTTVNTADQATLKQSATVPAVAPQPSPLSSVSSKPTMSHYSSSVGPNATVLKVGASAERQQAQRALAQQGKGLTEKAPSLMSKTALAPVPVKSPWAKLPDIDKVSPVPINPQLGYGQQGSVGPPMAAQPALNDGIDQSPAKEMSADDFSRGRRDMSAGQNRELFMPSSGRYEAVPESRRRASRHDPSFRAPAVLQRPSQTDSRAPAEPSAAFQTHRTSIEQGRRRASSSISGGSGQLARRMSLISSDTNPLMLEARSSAQTDVATAPPDVTSAPSQPSKPTYQARGNEQSAGGDSQLQGQDMEAARAAQRAAMKENIERARKRKVEEEQRLEAEKQERIKAKLASLGPDPKLVKAREEEEAMAKKAEEELRQKPMESLSASHSGQSPPKPPQPQATGEPQQYGMMKVHPLDTVKKISPGNSHVVPVNQSISETPSQQSHAQPSAGKTLSPPLNTGTHLASDNEKTASGASLIPDSTAKLNQKPVTTLDIEARNSWGTVRHEHRGAGTGSLWGLPSNKALGNGTFDQSLAGYSPQGLSRTSSTGQNWINGRTPTVGRSPQLHHATQHVPETRSHLLQSMTSPDSQPLSMNSEIDSVPPASQPAPIGPPQSLTHQHPYSTVPSGGQQQGVAAWNNFHNVARVQERADAERLQREFDDRREEEKRTGTRAQAPYTFNETFKQVQLGEQTGQRHITSVTPAAQTTSGAYGIAGSANQEDIAVRMPNGTTSRGSRFFPHAHTPTSHERRAVTYSHPLISRSPSPPPAEEVASKHPAFDGNHHRPVVHLPPEKVVVRLPPATASTPPPPPSQQPQSPPTPPPTATSASKAPMTWAARVAAPTAVPAPPPSTRSVSTPIAQTPSWQERFNGLLGKPPATGRTATSLREMAAPKPAASTSKDILELIPTAFAASVSLPTGRTVEAGGVSQLTSKDVEDEEDLFEDREAGSLPAINLPIGSSPVPGRESRRVSARLAIYSPAPESTSAHMFMVPNWNDRSAHSKAQYAIVRAPGGNGRSVRKDLPLKPSDGPDHARTRPATAAPFTQRHSRGRGGVKARPSAKAH